MLSRFNMVHLSVPLSWLVRVCRRALDRIRHLTHSRAAWMLGLIALAHFWVFSYQPGINNPNENVRFYMTAAMVEQHTYAIDAMRARWGWTNDAAVKDGHFYSAKAPGTSELGVPAYAAYYYGCRALGVPVDRVTALWVCRTFASIVPALLFAAFFRRFLRRRTPAETDPKETLVDATLVSTMLGSLLLAYSPSFVSHTQSAVVAFVAFDLLRRSRAGERSGSSRLAFAAGLLAACVTYFEYPCAPVSAALALYALVALRPSRYPFFAVGALIPVLLVMHFQWKTFGNAFTPGHLFLEDPGFRAQHRTGFFGLNGFHTEGFSLLTSPGYGLFPLTPLFWLAPLGLVILLRRPRERLDAIVALAVFVFPVLATITFAHWRGGWAVGPRHIAVVVPFVAWFAYEGLLFFAQRVRDVAAAIALATMLVGLLLSGVPSLWYPHVPEYFDRPLPQLFFTLVSHDYAPLTLLSGFGIYGSVALAPLLAIPAWLALRLVAAARRRLLVLVAAAALGVVLLLPSLVVSRPASEDIQRGTRFITSHWSPAGHDRVARLRAEMGGQNDPKSIFLLAALLDREHRYAEAAAVLRRPAP